MKIPWVRHRNLWLGGAVLILAAPIAALAAQSNAASPASRWIVDWGAQRCSLIRAAAGSQPVTMVLRSPLGSLRPELLLLGPWKTDPLGKAETADVVLAPSGARFTGQAVSGAKPGVAGRMLAIADLGVEFIDAYANAKQLTVEVGKNQVADLALPNARGAVKALTDCNNDLLTSWGLDPAAWTSMQRMPVPTGEIGAWISDNDYPSDALKKDQSGTVVARFEVGADGQVSDCVTVVSSGVPSLDRQTCKSLGKRKFDPAIGADGRPVPVRLVETIRWIIPGDDRMSLMIRSDPSPISPSIPSY